MWYGIYIFIYHKANKKNILELISNYFITIKINYYKIFHLYHLLWLKSISYLVTMQFQIQSNVKFWQKLFLFIKYAIKYSAYKNSYSKILD